MAPSRVTRGSSFRAALLVGLSLPLGASYVGSSSPGIRVADRARLGSLDVPRAAIGTIKWLPEPAASARLSATFGEAMRLGLDFVDTAERYGASPFAMVGQAARALGMPGVGARLGGSGEELLGALSAAASSPAVIASKFTPVPWRDSPESVVEAARASAARLGVAAVPLYQLHFPDVIQPLRWAGGAVPKDELYWEGLARAYHAGVVLNVGVSNYGPTLLVRCAAYLASRGVPLASNQIHYSLLYRKQGSQATKDWAQDHGVQTLAYFPLAMGLLTGRWSASALPPDRGLHKYFTGGDGGEGIAPLLAALEAVGAARGVTPAQVALNWVVSQGALPVAGATSPEQVRGVAGALGWRLAAEEALLLEAASDACGLEFGGSTFKPADAKFVGYGYERWALD